MDVDEITALHNALVDVGLPSSIANLKNPTEEYVRTLITQFLTHFHVDVSAVCKPTFDQLTQMLAEEDPEIISTINLSKTMASICVRIYLKDFNLMDIMNPVQKRTRRTAKFLSNFLLYYCNTHAEIEERLQKTRLKHQQMQELRNRRMAIKEAKNEDALIISRNSQLKAQLEPEIENFKMHIHENKSRKHEVEEKRKKAEQESIEADQRHANLIAQAIKVKERFEDIESRHVKSPDRHNALLREVTEQKKQCSEKREVILDALKTKTPAIEYLKSSLSIIRKARETTLLKCLEEYKDVEETENEKKQLEERKAELVRLVEQESTAGTDQGNEVNNEALEEAKQQCRKHLATFRKEQKRLLAEKKVLGKKIEDSQTRQRELLSKRDEIRAMIADKEAHSEKYLKDCVELCNAEIREENEFRDNLDKMLENLVKKDAINSKTLHKISPS